MLKSFKLKKGRFPRVFFDGSLEMKVDSIDVVTGNREREAEFTRLPMTEKHVIMTDVYFDTVLKVKVTFADGRKRRPWGYNWVVRENSRRELAVLEFSTLNRALIATGPLPPTTNPAPEPIDVTPEPEAEQAPAVETTPKARKGGFYNLGPVIQAMLDEIDAADAA